jgi:hypothetical protein
VTCAGTGPLAGSLILKYSKDVVLGVDCEALATALVFAF